MHEKSVEVIGTYYHTIHKNFITGTTVFSFLCKDFDKYKEKGKLMCKGDIPLVTRGVPLKLIGYFKIDEADSATFIVTNAELHSNSEFTTMEYLQNNRFKGIGPKTAKKIVDITGPDIFSFIKESDAIVKLQQISELKGEKAIKFVKTIEETFFEKEVYDFIRQHGGDYFDSQMVYNTYKSESINKLKTQPYEVGRETSLPFIVCDSIAKEMGIYPFHHSRIRYMIISALFAIANNGNTSATISEIDKNVAYIAKQSAFQEDIPSCTMIACTINKMSAVKSTIDENGDVIYTLKEFAMAEDVICNNLYKMSNTKKYYHCDIATEILETEGSLDITYSDAQRKTFDFLKTSGIKILTGGPGTGKTTVIRGIIDAYKRLHPDSIISLCAPTGRAAQKIKETTGMQAATIHRLLNIKPYESKDEIDFEVDKLESDLIIIDEMSMVDLKLFAYITNAIKEEATVILCGDTFQLPSVGAGNVLHDIINTKLFDTVHLDVIYRQKENSQILSLSQAIKEGNSTTFVKNTKKSDMKVGQETIKVTKLCSNKEVQIIRTNSAQNINSIIINTLKNTFLNETSPFYVPNILDLQVLASTKKEIAGTIELNKAIHDIYNKDSVKYGFFSVGDKIMMMENNYDIGYCNGDIGFITAIDNNRNVVTVEINDTTMEIPHSCIKDIALSYACTVHKSQGSEYQYVIISLPKEPMSMLQRNLIYTAVTRAKKYVAIICEDDAFTMSIKQNYIQFRRTNLKNKILRIFEESI